MKKLAYICCIALAILSCGLGYWVSTLKNELQAKEQEPNILQVKIDSALKDMSIQKIEKNVPIKFYPPVIGDWYDEVPQFPCLLIEKLHYWVEGTGGAMKTEEWILEYNRLVSSFNKIVDLYNLVCEENNRVLRLNNELSVANERLNDSHLKLKEKFSWTSDSLLISSAALELIEDKYNIVYQSKIDTAQFTRVVSIEAPRLDSALVVLDCYLD